MVSNAVKTDPEVVVIDNGTGYTKMGYAGNIEPSYLIPSVIARNVPKVCHHFIISRTSRKLDLIEIL